MIYSTLIEQLLLAALLGGLVGFERVWSGHPAGFRTNMLIAMSACMFTILSISTKNENLAAQIVTGVGFLGAGAIFHDHESTLGFTTAASIWLVAAIGMAVGTGDYFVALVATVAAILILRVLDPVSVALSKHARKRMAKKS